MNWTSGALLAAVSIATASPVVAQQWSPIYESEGLGFFGIGEVTELDSGLKSVWMVEADAEIADALSYTVRSIYIDCEQSVSISQTVAAYDAFDQIAGESTSEYAGEAMVGVAPTDPIPPNTIMGLYQSVACGSARLREGPRYAEPGPMIAVYRARRDAQD